MSQQLLSREASASVTSGSELHQQATAWRQRLHQRPELSSGEQQTSQFIEQTLLTFGLAPQRIAGTGIVATIRGAEDGPSIGLRADLDALPISETATPPWRSLNSGVMHACGHDGHMVMLLAAAQQLAAAPRFAGRVQLIFQPAEETGVGAKQMIAEGLFNCFPIDEIYGLHNWPGLATGSIAVHPGAVMAASTPFDVVIHGKGGHSAMPHLTRDPLYAACQIVSVLQSVVSRNLNSLDAAVVSVSHMTAGETHNIIPDMAVLQGTIRYLDPQVGELIQRRMTEIISEMASALGVTAMLTFSDKGTPAVINTPAEREYSLQAARAVAGEERVLTTLPASLTGEDFSIYLQHKPGAYVWLGNGEAAGLHAPDYDFNDEAIPTGVNYWLTLVKARLGNDS
ncbi:MULTISPECIES: amidohydrolase [Xenorhabdus]|uniref:amidohydrolase n=1 Tax=Xenorhabdus TaxID=626 RepID=UPI00064B1E0F|nr:MULTISPECIES: amidohydrolase [Xenorhabdus]KLU15220.1 hypothetical protein AAY47_12045 [Xenorhabdus griffiniae]KOP31718.1 hypothetical protein AFK69_19390 [Xenorhabdus sp. GDc328]